MALSEDRKNEIKAMVLIELENLFTSVSHKYNTEENHEMMLFLLDIENELKQRLMDVQKQSE
ncbi:MAG: hypothetical protein ACR2MG_02760 [Pyrinomonadaceae bacterium]